MHLKITLTESFPRNSTLLFLIHLWYLLISRFLKKNTLLNVSLETHLSLLADSRFKESISKRTTDIENIKRRISIAGHTLFGVVLE